VEVIALPKDKQCEKKHNDVTTESQPKETEPGYGNKKTEGSDRPST